MIIVLSYNFWTKDTWFALAELAFLRWLYIVLMDLVLAHCIRTFVVVAFFTCALNLFLTPMHYKEPSIRFCLFIQGFLKYLISVSTRVHAWSMRMKEI